MTVVVERGKDRSAIYWHERGKQKVVVPEMSNESFAVVEEMLRSDCEMSEVEEYMLELDELQTVECLICGKKDGTLRWHLTEHGLNAEGYKRMFPGAKTHSPISDYKKSRNCTLKKRDAWKDPESLYNKVEYRDKLSRNNSERLNVLWADPSSSYNSEEYAKKLSLMKKEEWKNMSVEERRKRIDKLHKFENQFGERGYALDGHYVASKGEMKVDNWLFINSVEHTVHPRVDGTHYFADFLVDDLYIEYDGFWRETDEDWHGKLSAYKENNLKYLIIKPEDDFEAILEEVL